MCIVGNLKFIGHMENLVDDSFEENSVLVFDRVEKR